MRLIIPLSFIIISVAIFFIGLNPLFNNMTEVKREVKAYKEALDSSSELQLIRDSLIEKYKNIKKEDKDRLNQFLPTNIDNIELILEIERIANLSGMPIENFVSNNEDSNKNLKDVDLDGSMLDSLENSTYGEFPFEFSVKGRYETFLNFLKELELNLRLINVKEIKISVPTSSSSTSGPVTDVNVYNYSLKIETYWLK
jgi:Tfp pilus assembly protein PilO